MMSRKITRRTMLRGLGVAMALPWLESIPALGAVNAGAAGGAGALGSAAGEAPRRLGIVFMGNGVNPHHWGATQTSQGMTLARTLTPLEPLKDKLLVIKGLYNQTTKVAGEGHYSKMNLLSGLKVKRTTTDVEIGTTMDQLIARKLADQTPLPSLVIGTQPPGYGTDQGYTGLYSAHLSWASPTAPAPKEIYPQLAFDRLFSDGASRKQDRSVLDVVLSDARALQGRVSASDRRKLDEYFSSVRELEERIDRAAAGGRRNGAWEPTVQQPTFDRPGAELPDQLQDHMKILFDIMVLAFQMDRTRVVSYMMNNDLSQANFGFLGVKGGQHELSHHSNNAEKLAMYQKVNQYHIQLLAEALTKMEATREGERSLLDNSMILFCSSLYDGNAHESTQLPILLAGGGGGSVRGGRLLDYSGDDNRKLCRLHLALMHRMGVNLDRFGDADQPLTELV